MKERKEGQRSVSGKGWKGERGVREEGRGNMQRCEGVKREMGSGGWRKGKEENIRGDEGLRKGGK